MTPVSLVCRDISLAYESGADVLKGLSLDVAPGEFFALLGPSGSGKSTLLRVIAGFVRQQRGQVLVDGVDIGGQPAWQRGVGMVFQSYALWPHLSVWDNVAFGLVERRMDKATTRSKVGAMLDMVGLSEHARRRPSQLSGGQQQRVALARTLVVEPRLLLLDEPLSNLDKGLRVQMRSELLALQRRLAITTVFVTHDQEEALACADRLAVLDAGVLQQLGAPQAVYDAPVNSFVGQFLGHMNQLAARVLARSGSTLRLDVQGVGEVSLPLGLDAPASPQLTLCFRPSALRFEPDDSSAPAPLWPMNAMVVSSEFAGEFVRYQLDVGGQRLVAEKARHAGQAVLAPGQGVRLGLDLRQMRRL